MSHKSMIVIIFFFRQKTAYEIRISDWSSDLCSSDLTNRVGRIRTFVKKVEAALEAGDKDAAATALAQVQPELQRGVARGVLHKNTASRKFSRLTKRLSALA